MHDPSVNSDNKARTIALVLGMLVGTFIGIRIGNGARKRVDRWAPSYLCLFGRGSPKSPPEG